VTDSDLKDLYEWKARAMARRPIFGRSSAQARVVLRDGCACIVDQQGDAMRVDLPPEEGGSGTGPHPGQLMRASVGACLALGYRVWGARLEVPILGVEVDITCEYDARGQMGVADDVAIGWLRLSADVTIVSPAPEAEVRRVVETADRLNPMLANLSRDVERTFQLTVVRPPAIT
jgi:uncharacterized OsmC-like protein